MINLCLHCGARRVDRELVERSRTPPSSATWVPVPHHRLLGQVESTLTAGGLTVVNEAHALWNDGERYFGLLEVQNGHASSEYGLVVGLRNSHDKSFPAAIGLGSGVFVCDNLAFSAEVTIAAPPHAVYCAGPAAGRKYGRRASGRHAWPTRPSHRDLPADRARRSRGARSRDPRGRCQCVAGHAGAVGTGRVASSVVPGVCVSGQDRVAALQRLHRDLERSPARCATAAIASAPWSHGCGLRPRRVIVALSDPRYGITPLSQRVRV